MLALRLLDNNSEAHVLDMNVIIHSGQRPRSVWSGETSSQPPAASGECIFPGATCCVGWWLDPRAASDVSRLCLLATVRENDAPLAVAEACICYSVPLVGLDVLPVADGSAPRDVLVVGCTACGVVVYTRFSLVEMSDRSTARFTSSVPSLPTLSPLAFRFRLERQARVDLSKTPKDEQSAHVSVRAFAATSRSRLIPDALAVCLIATESAVLLTRLDPDGNVHTHCTGTLPPDFSQRLLSSDDISDDANTQVWRQSLIRRIFRRESSMTSCAVSNSDDSPHSPAVFRLPQMCFTPEGDALLMAVGSRLACFTLHHRAWSTDVSQLPIISLHTLPFGCTFRRLIPLSHGAVSSQATFGCVVSETAGSTDTPATAERLCVFALKTSGSSMKLELNSTHHARLLGAHCLAAHLSARDLDHKAFAFAATSARSLSILWEAPVTLASAGVASLLEAATHAPALACARYKYAFDVYALGARANNSDDDNIRQRYVSSFGVPSPARLLGSFSIAGCSSSVLLRDCRTWFSAVSRDLNASGVEILVTAPFEWLQNLQCIAPTAPDIEVATSTLSLPLTPTSSPSAIHVLPSNGSLSWHSIDVAPNNQAATRHIPPSAFSLGRDLLSSLLEAGNIVWALVGRLCEEGGSAALNATEFVDVRFLMTLRGIKSPVVTPDALVDACKTVLCVSSLRLELCGGFSSGRAAAIITPRTVSAAVRAEVTSRLCYLAVALLAWHCRASPDDVEHNTLEAREMVFFTTQTLVGLIDVVCSCGTNITALAMANISSGQESQIAAMIVVSLLEPFFNERVPRVLRVLGLAMRLDDANLEDGLVSWSRVWSGIFPVLRHYLARSLLAIPDALDAAAALQAVSHLEAASSFFLACDIFNESSSVSSGGEVTSDELTRILKSLVCRFFSSEDPACIAGTDMLISAEAGIAIPNDGVAKMVDHVFQNISVLSQSASESNHEQNDRADFSLLRTEAAAVLYRVLCLRHLTVALAHPPSINRLYIDAGRLRTLALHLGSPALTSADGGCTSGPLSPLLRFASRQHARLAHMLFLIALRRADLVGCVRYLQDMCDAAELSSGAADGDAGVAEATSTSDLLRGPKGQQIHECVRALVARSLASGLRNFLGAFLRRTSLAMLVASEMFVALERETLTRPADTRKRDSLLTTGAMVLVAFLVQRGARGSAASAALHFAARLRATADPRNGAELKASQVHSTLCGVSTLLSVALNIAAQVPPSTARTGGATLSPPRAATFLPLISAISSPSVIQTAGNEHWLHPTPVILRIQPATASDVPRLRRLLALVQAEIELGPETTQTAAMSETLDGTWWTAPDVLCSSSHESDTGGLAAAKSPCAIVSVPPQPIRVGSGGRHSLARVVPAAGHLIRAALTPERSSHSQWAIAMRCAALAEPHTPERTLPLTTWTMAVLCGVYSGSPEMSLVNNPVRARGDLQSALLRFISPRDNYEVLEHVLICALRQRGEAQRVDQSTAPPIGVVADAGLMWLVTLARSIRPAVLIRVLLEFAGEADDTAVLVSLGVALPMIEAAIDAVTRVKATTTNAVIPVNLHVPYSLLDRVRVIAIKLLGEASHATGGGTVEVSGFLGWTTSDRLREVAGTFVESLDTLCATQLSERLGLTPS